MTKNIELHKVNHDAVPPFLPPGAKVLLLGSFPSEKSREEHFYYMHPTNRFYRVLESLFHVKSLSMIEDRKAFLQAHHIALYDVLSSCEIYRSQDATIQNPRPLDLASIRNQVPTIQEIGTTGKTAATYFRRFFPDVPFHAFSSTSGMNRVSLPALVQEYSLLLDWC